MEASRSGSRGPSAPVLRLDGVSKRFPGVVANDDVSLTVERGEIHALLGENGAGKTTLMNVVFGLLEPDSGRIEVSGTAAEISSPRDAFGLGIGMVHQHFKLVSDMTVSENVALARGESGLGSLRLSEVRARLLELSGQFGLEVDPDTLIEDLTVGGQQRVEIMKLLFRGAELLILDEPTGVLTPPEWAHLAAVLRALADEGRAIIFISHKLDEVTTVADRCTVLRDGKVVGTRKISGVSKKQLAKMMVGREVALRVSREPLDPGQPVLELKGVGLRRDERDLLAELDLTVSEREVVGIAGVDGNGQRELVEAITGVSEATGEIRIDGSRLERHDPAAYIAAGGALVPADRQRTGIAQQLTLTENLMIKGYAQAPFARRGWLNRPAMRRRAAELVEEFDIRSTGLDAPLGQLSGGNQQKVVLARELDRDPRLLIASQPTRGLDVGAAEFVYERLARYKRAGGAVLLISTELDEILSLADRVAVMVSGRFLDILDAGDTDPERLGMLMGGERAARADGSGGA